jgi:anti-sigma B factor antagonist
MPEASLACYPRRDPGRTVLVLEGCLDVVTSPRGIELMENFIREHGPNVVFDTERLDFIDSKGVGALLSAAKLAKDGGGSISLPNAPFPVRKILETCGLLPLFSPVPPAGAAVEDKSEEAAKPRATRKRATAG